MNDLELVGYADLHCRTDRALFHRDHVIRLYRLAGQDLTGCDVLPEFFGWHDYDGALDVIKLARERVRHGLHVETRYDREPPV